MKRKTDGKTCPKCNQIYFGPPALSRNQDFTYICPDCGTREALESLGLSIEEQDKILNIIHNTRTDGDLEE